MLSDLHVKQKLYYNFYSASFPPQVPFCKSLLQRLKRKFFKCF